MVSHPSFPLALIVVGGCLAAGFAAEASALDQRIGDFIPVDDATLLEAEQATGEADNGSIDVVHLAVETAGPGTVNVTELAVADGQETVATELEALRDEDASLETGILDGSDLARVTVSLASPVEGGEERTLVLTDGDGTQTPVTLRAPTAVQDGFTRMSVG